MTDKIESFIQWKGTSACIDLWCQSCGKSCHFDGDFLYAWVCPYCKARWEMPTHLAMTPLPPDYVGCLQHPEADEEGQ